MNELTIKKRNSSVELLRILSMLGVIFLHYQNASIGGAIALVDSNSSNYELILIIKSFALCAVNVFILITGYYSYKKDTLNKSRIIELIAQTVLFSEGFYVLSVVTNNSTIRFSDILINALPTNWFVVLYISLYCCSVYINRICDGMTKKQNTSFILLIFVLFSIWPTIVDILQEVTGEEFHGLSTVGIEGSQNGYTIVNFVLVYLIGNYLGRYKVKQTKRTTIIYALGLAICILIVYIWQHINTRTATEYCNPILIIEAVSLLVLFSKVEIYSNVINWFAKASFTVYLTHIALIKRAHIEMFVNAKIYVFVLHIVCTILIIYFAGSILWFIWDKIYKLLLNVSNKAGRIMK